MAAEDRENVRAIDTYCRMLVDQGGNLVELLRCLTGMRLADGEPFPYRDLMRVDEAQRRAHAVMAILSGDLDNNGSVTREEVATTPRLNPRKNEMAKLFLTGDLDADGVFSPEEIKTAAGKPGPQGGRP